MLKIGTGPKRHEPRSMGMSSKKGVCRLSEVSHGQRGNAEDMKRIDGEWGTKKSMISNATTR